MDASSFQQMQSPMGKKSVEQIRESLHRRIDQADERFLQILFAMTEAYAQQHDAEGLSPEEEALVNAGPDWAPTSQEELLAELRQAEAEIDRGEFYTLEEIKKESEQW